MDEAQYPPIDDYAIIGDCRTAALVSREGSIDWLCLPDFSSPSVFAAILDQRRGGRFALRPRGDLSTERRYVGDTNVLETTFTTPGGIVKVTDCMPIPGPARFRRFLHPQREVLRIIEVTRGEVEMEVLFEPRPDYGRVRRRLERRGALGWTCPHGDQLLMLHGDLSMNATPDGMGAYGRERLSAGQKRYLSLTYVKRDVAVIQPVGEQSEADLEATLEFWDQWSTQCLYRGPYRDIVMRSALTLKLLTFGLSGALIAAPTTSLPGRFGGVRNWDYRFCWLRDAALTLRAFVDLGFRPEGDAFMGWLLHATRLTWPELQVLYDVYGETRVEERELEHLEGYRQSRPVRIGNAAAGQLQLDVYGEVVLAAYSYVLRGGTLDLYERRLLVGFGRCVCREWRKPDHGIWEFRDEGRHNTYSKLMCWVALDRLIKLHEMGKLRIPTEKFYRERQALRESIESQGFNPEVGTYVSAYGDPEIDASLLLMSRYGFASARDERMHATFARIERELTRNGLVYRYREGLDDFLPPGEGAFVITSFWAVDYLAQLGDIPRATKRFEQLASLANDVGLLAEEVDPDTQEALGNFPQAFSHVGLITAALALAEARNEHELPVGESSP